MAKSEYDFDSYLAEARPTPFRLRVSADEIIEIEYPSSERMMQVDESVTARAVLSNLCGDQWERVHELIGDKHAKVMEKLAGDMREHFGLSGNRDGGTQK